ncbi:hypothetical protein [Legionella nagasakiensis]|uniref:hypothetical protein n=1 Tax=Legionella nagasakiensis TaxID=535290 RepID=UPI0013EFB47D|nr:hypothetical protein [Legionella nagasakiensis]
MKTLGSLLDSQFQILLLMIGSAFFAATGFIMPLWAEFTQQLGGGGKSKNGGHCSRHLFHVVWTICVFIWPCYKLLQAE